MRNTLILLTLGALSLTACHTSVDEPAPAAYHNPLDLIDGGIGRDGGSGSVGDGGAPQSQGTVDGRTPNLSTAIYQVVGTDGGNPGTNVYIADVGDLCAAAGSDAGLGVSWDVLAVHVAGDSPAAYPVAAVLPPQGAIAQFEFQSDGGGFGTVQAEGGSVTLKSIDPSNTQTIGGSYTVSFSLMDGGSTTLAGAFSATPCAAVPPAPSD